MSLPLSHLEELELLQDWFNFQFSIVTSIIISAGINVFGAGFCFVNSEDSPRVALGVVFHNIYGIKLKIVNDRADVLNSHIAHLISDQEKEFSCLIIIE
jgi:hypothetical protein